MRIVVRPQRIVIVSQLEDDPGRRRARDIIDLMKGARPGETLTDVLSRQYMAQRTSEGKARFEHMFEHGDYSADQGRLFEKAKKEDILKLEAEVYAIIPEKPQQEIRWNLWEVVVKAYPELSNSERQELLETVVEDLILNEKIEETSDMKYSRRPPRFAQSAMDEFT